MPETNWFIPSLDKIEIMLRSCGMSLLVWRQAEKYMMEAERSFKKSHIWINLPVQDSFIEARLVEERGEINLIVLRIDKSAQFYF